MRFVTVIFLFCALSVVNSSEIPSTHGGESKELDSTRKSRDGVEEEGDDNGVRKKRDCLKDENGEECEQDGLNFVLILFSVSVLALLFFFMLDFCPPLCRLENRTTPRPYIDTQLQTGEIF